MRNARLSRVMKRRMTNLSEFLVSNMRYRLPLDQAGFSASPTRSLTSQVPNDILRPNMLAPTKYLNLDTNTGQIRSSSLWDGGQWL